MAANSHNIKAEFRKLGWRTVVRMPKPRKRRRVQMLGQGFPNDQRRRRIPLKLNPFLNRIAPFCLVGFFFPYFQYTTFHGISARKFTLGLPFSPRIIASWKEAKEAKTEKAEDGTIRAVHCGDFSSSVNVEFISGSSLLGVVGLGLSEVKRRLKIKESPAA